jgi:hypothetical protein
MQMVYDLLSTLPTKTIAIIPVILYCFTMNDLNSKVGTSFALAMIPAGIIGLATGAGLATIIGYAVVIAFIPCVIWCCRR